MLTDSCVRRYHEMKGRNRGRIFRAEFHAVDCTKQRARDFYRSGGGQWTNNIPQTTIYSGQWTSNGG